MKTAEPAIERHPWAPYVPDGARILFLGTFPPKPVRWSMPFYYPNKMNDFWRVMGVIFFDGNRDALWNNELKRFDLDAIKAFLNREGIALWDTGMAVRRLKDNASDKFLDIVEPIDLAALLDAHPTIKTVVTTGEKATGVIAAQAGVEIPSIGQPVDTEVGGHDFTLWRMPSTSRAYPLALEKKAAAYRAVFNR
ncbi:MAG: uracil-DNA glycosylase family protein [Muribaculaceae bacterium]|nr:uracil-DNA glycosylase family protein [Muribaculaceae bacterium]